MIGTTRALTVLLIASLTACGEGGQETEGGAEATADSAGAMAGMEGMAGMPMGDTAMAGRMRVHMREMEAASGDALVAMRDEHRQMTANMLAEMNREMTEMGMTSDAAWTATADSLREDLTRMPELTAAEMEAMMPDHHRRVERLITSHEAMMSAMGH